MGWTAVRLRDVTNDGVLDLVVVANRPNGAASWLFVFRGVNSQSRFDFDTPYFRVQLPFHAPDVEVLDANGDGIKDIYVMQTELVGYCKPTGEGCELFFSESFMTLVVVGTKASHTCVCISCKLAQPPFQTTGFLQWTMLRISSLLDETQYNQKSIEKYNST